MAIRVSHSGVSRSSFWRAGGGNFAIGTRKILQYFPFPPPPTPETGKENQMQKISVKMRHQRDNKTKYRVKHKTSVTTNFLVFLSCKKF